MHVISEISGVSFNDVSVELELPRYITQYLSTTLWDDISRVRSYTVDEGKRALSSTNLLSPRVLSPACSYNR